VIKNAPKMDKTQNFHPYYSNRQKQISQRYPGKSKKNKEENFITGRARSL